MTTRDPKTGHEIRLVHSPDDNGWYWEDMVTWKTSQLYKDASRAMNAVKRFQSLKWEK